MSMTSLQSPTVRDPLKKDARHPVVEPLRKATGRVGLTDLAARLAEVQGWLADDLTELEVELSRLVDTADRGDLATRAAGHLLAHPGKRVRPICVLLGAHIADHPIDAPFRKVAVACELVHAATLLHDDVIDEGSERRGAATSRIVYSNSASILGGDFLLIEALQRVAAVGSPRLMTSLLDTIGEMVAAEAVQLEQRHRLEPSRDAYLNVIEGKTASLFRWALRAATLAQDEVSERRLRALGEAGTALGMAFQLVDDCLDLAGDAAQTGKDLFADLLQGKLTWPLILACEADPSIAPLLRELQARREVTPAEASDLTERIIATDALEQTRRFAHEQRTVAHRALSALPSSRALSAIQAVVDAAVARSK